MLDHAATTHASSDHSACDRPLAAGPDAALPRAAGRLARCRPGLVVAAFLAAMSLAVVGAAAALRTANTRATYGAWVEHTHAVLAALDALDASVSTADATQRGYLLTGDPRSLTRGADAPAEAQRALGQVRWLTRDHPRQQTRLDTLSALLAVKLADLDETRGLAKREGRDAALTAARSRRGEALTQQICDVLRAVRGEEDVLLAARVRREAAAGRRVQREILLTVLGGVAAAAVGVLLLWREATRSRRALDALAAAEARFRAVFVHAPVGIAVLDAEGTIMGANDAFGELVSRPPATLPGTPAAALSPAEAAEATGASVRALLAGEVQEARVETRFTRPDGAVRLATMSLACLPGAPDADGRDHVAIIGIAQDITEQRDAEAALREREAQVRGALDASLDAFLLCRAVRDGAGEIVEFVIVDGNGRADALLGTAGVRLIGRGVSATLPAAGERGVRELCRGVVATGEPATFEYETIGPDATARWLKLQVSVADGVAITARDTTAERRAVDALRAQAHLDELTGLLNRRGFLAAAEREWQRARREGRAVVVAYVDLNAFKAVNDDYGHAEGDAALRAAADVLRAALRGSDVIGRLGGDEFAVFVASGGPGGAVDALSLERRVRERMAHHLTGANAAARAAGRPYDIGMGVGTASMPGAAATPPSLSALMALADERLYADKRARRHSLARELAGV